MTEAEARAALRAFVAVGEIERWIADQRWEAVPGGWRVRERFDRFQQRRIAEVQEAAAHASEAARIASLEAEARRPLWQRIFRRRGRP